MRLLREITEETKDAVGDTCAVPIRISVDELMGEGGLYKEEVEDMIGLMADAARPLGCDSGGLGK